MKKLAWTDDYEQLNNGGELVEVEVDEEEKRCCRRGYCR